MSRGDERKTRQGARGKRKGGSPKQPKQFRGTPPVGRRRQQETHAGSPTDPPTGYPG